MKRFSPYTKYQMNGQTRYASIAPDGKRLDSASWHEDRINEIRYIFLQKDRNNQFRLKPYQKEIMTSILSGSDTFVILPTGSGKSLCFQAPSIFFPGITLVVTPLAALIEDQVSNFNRNNYPIHHASAKNYYDGIQFKAIYPGMDGLSSQAMFAEMQAPRKNSGSGRRIQYKFLYVSPERLCNPKFLRQLREAEDNGLRIGHVVIDEVHCMSQWGFEFRESYLYLPHFIEQRPMRPIISAFTATATPKDIAEIKNMLRFPTDPSKYADKKYREIFHMAKRENLRLHVLPCSDYDADREAGGKASAEAGKDPQGVSGKTRQDALLGLLAENLNRVCIIYRTTASGVDELYQILSGNELLRDRIVKYHAQMPKQAKNRSKNQFRNNNGKSQEPYKNIMIATKAFGMGIDKRDISLVIHYDCPRSLEDYYQEAGRAGRDAQIVQSADCYLLYSVGPKKEKGTLQYTINWVTSGKDAPGSGCMPISSQFSEDMKENIYFWSYYRLCYVMKYCNAAARNPDAAHSFILKYLENGFTAKQVMDSLDYFYHYIVNYYPVPPKERERFLRESLFQGSDAARFPGACPGQAKEGADRYHAEIRQLTSEINELHINNTYLANLLRHHPEKYEPGVPYVLSEDLPGSGQEWKSRQNKKVKGAASLSLRPSDISQDSAFLFVSNPGNCEEYVNEAWNRRQNKEPASLVFTVNYHHVINNVFKMQDGRWKALTDRDTLVPYARYLGCSVKGLFPKGRYGQWRRTKKSSKNPADPQAIESADSLFAYAFGAKPHELTFTIHGSGKLDYFDMCVLDAVYSIEAARKETVYVQTIWEILTGRSPGYSSREKLLFRKNIQDSIDKMRAMSISIQDSQCDYRAGNAVFLPLREKPRGQKGYSYDCLPPLFLYAEEMNGQIVKVPVSLFNVSKIRESALSHRLRPSMENVLLCHYLLHRTAVSRNSRRGNFILFSTIRSVTGICQDSCLFQKKAAALMSHYQAMGFVRRYYLYITDYRYQFTDGTVITDTAYFRVKAAHAGESLPGTGPLLLSDFDLVWSWRHNERLQNDNANSTVSARLVDAMRRDGRRLSADTKRALVLVSLGRMDGIALHHE